MKIVDRALFLRLPGGTIYAKFDSANQQLGPLQIKLGTSWLPDNGTAGDWVFRDLLEIEADNSDELWNILMAGSAGKPIPLDFALEGGRDGLFHPEQRFAVLDINECVQLLHMLTCAVGGDAR